MNVLYISYDGMTDPLGQSQVIPYLNGLAKLSHKIFLISFEKQDRWATSATAIEAQLRLSGIEWLPMRYTAKPPVLSTLYDVFCLKRKVAEVIKTNNIHIVHCRSYISALVGEWAKRKFDTAFVFDMRGFWADERVEGGIWKLSNPVFKMVYSYFKKKETDFLLSADEIVSLTLEAKSVLDAQYTKTKELSISVIPCCVDVEHFDRTTVSLVDIENIRTDLGVSDDAFVLSYLGSIGTWYLLDEMLDFYARLLSEMPNAYFLFITMDSEAKIKNVAAKKNIPLDRILVKGAARVELPKILRLSDASLFFIKPSYSKKASSPTKMGELLSMGIPLICNDGVGDVGFVMKTANAGILLKECTATEYDKACGQLSWLKQIDKAHLREMAIHHFSLSTGVRSYNDIYMRIEKNKGKA